MRSRCLDARNGFLQIVERSSASGARDVFRFGLSQTSGLQHTKGRFISLSQSRSQHDAIGQSVYHKQSHVGCRLDLEIFLLVVAILLAEDDGVGEAFSPHFVHQSAKFSSAVGVVALCNDHHLAVCAQTSLHLIIQLSISQEEEFGRRRISRHEHQILWHIGRISAFFSRPVRGVDDGSRHASAPILGQCATKIGIVGAR